MFDKKAYNKEYRSRPGVRIRHLAQLRICTDKWYKTSRQELFHILGDKCARCGVNDIRCLQIDHINGGGYKEAKKLKGINGIMRYYLHNPDLIKSNLQILCANCNWIKRAERKEYVSIYPKR